MKETCQVYFVGAGPGDPDLITVKGRKCIQAADLVLYAGYLVPRALVACAKESAVVADSSGMTLEETHALMVETVRKGGRVARVHTGDPSLYGAVKEQMIRLDQEDIDYAVIPGVTVAFAAAAAAKTSFTLPEKVQTLMFTRVSGRTSVPARERLQDLARHRTSVAIYLSASNPETVQDELVSGGYPEETPVVVAYRIGWSDERVLTTKLSALAQTVKEAGIRKQAVFLILPGQEDDPVFSRLYDPAFCHGFRR